MRRLLPQAAPAIAALALAATLGGCGFTPLYAVPGVSAGLSSIEVKAPHGRTAFLLAEDLDDAFARDRTTTPVYRLEFLVNEHRYPRGLRIDNVANVYETHVNIDYKLIEIATERVVKEGSTPVQVDYDVADQPYAGIAAQQDSEQRAADEAAQRMRIDLAIFFKNPIPRRPTVKPEDALVGAIGTPQTPAPTTTGPTTNPMLTPGNSNRATTPTDIVPTDP
jgi:LPS-assembly lipoprotein